MPLPRDQILEERLEHDRSKIRKAEMFRRCLTDQGFAAYVRSFYETVEGISADVRPEFGETETLAPKFWKNGEKIAGAVLVRHGGGATSQDGRRFVEASEISAFADAFERAVAESECPAYLVCATSVWFSSEARELCSERSVAPVDFSGLLKMDAAYPLETFVRQTAEQGRLKEYFSTFWLGKYLSEYARTEKATKAVLEDSKSALGNLMAEIGEVPKKREVAETIFTPRQDLEKPQQSKWIAGGIALASLAAWIAMSDFQNDAPAPIATSAVESRNAPEGSR